MSSTGAWDSMIDQHASDAATAAVEIVQVRDVKFSYGEARLWSYRLVKSLLQRSVNPAGVMAQFQLLVLNEPHRVAKLLLSLESGRYGDVLRGLHAYRAPVTGGTLDGTVDEGCYGDLEDAKDEGCYGSGTDDPEDAKFEAEHYSY